MGSGECTRILKGHTDRVQSLHVVGDLIVTASKVRLSLSLSLALLFPFTTSTIRITSSKLMLATGQDDKDMEHEDR
jgi:hypothetical protein